MPNQRMSLLGFVAVSLFALSTCAQSGFAQDNSNDNKQTRSNQSSSDQQHAQKLIKWLDDEVDLDSDQKQEIRKIAQSNSNKMQSKWQSLQQAQAQAIELEAMMLASMQDQMSESQKQEFREGQQSRREQAAQPNRDQNNRNRADRDRSDQNRNDRNRGDRDNSRDNNRSDRDQANTGQSQRDNSPEGQYVWAVIIEPARSQMRSQDLSRQQKQKCEEACQQFHQELTNCWKKINRLHQQLVTMEAKQLRQVEKVLTDDQLAKLKNARDEKATSASRSSSDDTVNR